jgi:hypothetical protein
MLINPTTRCFPRTTRDAFQQDQSVIEHYKRPVNYFFVVAILFVVGIIVCLLAKEM